MNNCSFEIAGDGLDAMFIETTYPVAAGEELLVDYGKKFLSQRPLTLRVSVALRLRSSESGTEELRVV